MTNDERQKALNALWVSAEEASKWPVGTEYLYHKLGERLYGTMKIIGGVSSLSSFYRYAAISFPAPQPLPSGWWPPNSRLPTRQDGDVNENVWAYRSGHSTMVSLERYMMVDDGCYWKPTGLVRPEKPEGV